MENSSEKNLDRIIKFTIFRLEKRVIKRCST